MASISVIKEEDFSCPVCYNIYKDPVVLSCCHSFCNACLKKWWTKNPLCECPVCKTRSSSNNPPRNLALKNLCEAFLQERAQRASVGSEEVCSLHSEKLQLFCLDHLHPVCLVCRDSEEHSDHSFKPINEAAQRCKAEVQKSLEPLKEKLNFLKKDKADWVKAGEQIKLQAQKTVRQIDKDFEKLQKVLRHEREARICAVRKEEKNKSEMMEEKTEGLKREIEAVSDSIRDVEKKLEAPDVSFLQHYKATVERAQRPLPREPQWPSAALTDLSKHLENLKLTSLVEEIKHILKSARARSVDHRVSALTSDQRTNACKLTLDPNTVYGKLVVSGDNKKATYGMYQYYPDHPDRFDYWDQVLCREALTGRCYWEVDWKGWVSIGVTYRGISRKGKGDDSCLGCNDKSWLLECSVAGYTARHNNITTPIPLSSSVCVCDRVGVYVDWPAGSLSFYTVSSDTLTHIHTFCCTFTGELLPAFRVVWGWTTASVSLCQME